jgi:uracil-DNA glycosylase family 4
LVRGVGPSDASIILVGEAPGRDEVFYGEPFVGQAGRLQAEEGWGPVGLRRSEVRIENVVEQRPDGNKLDGLAPSAVEWWQRHLHVRLDALLGDLGGQGRVVVPTGNLALNTLLRAPLPVYRTGPKQGQWRLRPPTGIVWPNRIGQYRGSLLEYQTNSGVEVRMIPTTHPASFLYGNQGYEAWQGDWRRITSEVAAGCPEPMAGDDVIATSGKMCHAWLAQAGWGRADRRGSGDRRATVALRRGRVERR